MSDIMIDKIIRSGRRTIGLEIGRDGSLIVRAPKNTPLAAIERLISEKRGWIIEKQRIVRERLAAVPGRQFVTGEQFLVLGKPYPLQVSEDTRAHLSFSGSQFILKKRYTKQARRLFWVWYRTKAAEIIPTRVAFYARKHGIPYKAVKISWAKSRWGSATTTGNLNFSWRLVMAPITVIDYVVVHELAHMIERNHSRRFWEHVASLYPNHERARKWLKDNGHLLTLGSDDTVSDPERL